MGVKGLHNYVERRLPPAEHVIRLADLRSMSGSDTVVVDVSGMVDISVVALRPPIDRKHLWDVHSHSRIGRGR